MSECGTVGAHDEPDGLGVGEDEAVRLLETQVQRAKHVARLALGDGARHVDSPGAAARAVRVEDVDKGGVDGGHHKGIHLLRILVGTLHVVKRRRPREAHLTLVIVAGSWTS